MGLVGRVTSLLLLIAFAGFSVLAQPDSEVSGEKVTVVVASKIDTEGALLGNMILHVLNNSGIPTEDRTEFGTTDVIRRAIKSGEIHIYPEYTGNGAYFYEYGDSTVWKDHAKGYEAIKKLDWDAEQIRWLTPAPANNTWAIAARKELVDAGVVSLSDLARYMDGGGEVKLACSEEFVSRPDSLPTFEESYGFKFEKDQLLILSGGNTATTEKAAARGTDGVNLAMAYGTDGQLSALNLVVLEDNLQVQPVYAPTPIATQKVLDSYPEVEGLLKEVFVLLDGPTLQRLNSAIAVEGRDAGEVSGEFLRENGLIN